MLSRNQFFAAVKFPECHQALSAPKAWNDAYERLLSEMTAQSCFDMCTLEIQQSSKQRQQDTLDEYAALIRSVRARQFDVAVENVQYSYAYIPCSHTD